MNAQNFSTEVQVSVENLQDILADEGKTAALEKRLYEYSGATKQSVAALMTAYELRVMKKQEYLALWLQ